MAGPLIFCGISEKGPVGNEKDILENLDFVCGCNCLSSAGVGHRSCEDAVEAGGFLPGTDPGRYEEIFG